MHHDITVNELQNRSTDTLSWLDHFVIFLVTEIHDSWSFQVLKYDA